MLQGRVYPTNAVPGQFSEARLVLPGAAGARRLGRGGRRVAHGVHACVSARLAAAAHGGRHPGRAAAAPAPAARRRHAAQDAARRVRDDADAGLRGGGGGQAAAGQPPPRRQRRPRRSHHQDRGPQGGALQLEGQVPAEVPRAAGALHAPGAHLRSQTQL